MGVRVWRGVPFAGGTHQKMSQRRSFFASSSLSAFHEAYAGCAKPPARQSIRATMLKPNMLEWCALKQAVAVARKTNVQTGELAAATAASAAAAAAAAPVGAKKEKSER